MKKKTHDEYAEELKIKRPDIEVLEKYINSTTPIKHKCICGNENWLVKPMQVLHYIDTYCMECSGSHKLSNEEYVALLNLINQNIKPIENYINMNTAILHKCSCGNNNWLVKPASVLKGHKCMICSGKIKKTTEQFKQEVCDLVGEEYMVLGEYKNNNTKILIKHMVCNHEYMITPTKFLCGNRCTKCSGRFKRTHEKYLEDLNVKRPNIIVLEKYINSNTAIRHKCECGNDQWYVKPNDVLRGKNCKNCKNKKTPKTHEEYVKELSQKRPDILVVEQYVNSKTPILHLCSCGDTWKIAPNNVLNKSVKCKKCGLNQVKFKLSKSQDEYLLQISAIRPQVKVLDLYINFITPINHQCECGNVWKATPSAVVYGGKCGVCTSKQQKTTVSFIREMFELFGNEYTVLGEYKTTNDKVLIRHNSNECNNYEFYATPKNLLYNHSGCPKCSRKALWTTEKFKSKVFNLVGNEYTVLGEYEGSLKKILVQHNSPECNFYQFKVKPSHFLGKVDDIGTRCPLCNKSKGELKIRDILIQNKIQFTPQYEFLDLRGVGGNTLKFDFAVLKNNNVFCLIEFQGKQHYEWIPGMMTKKGFEILQEHDKRKKEYLINKQIKFLEISYTDQAQIEQILSREFSDITIS